MVMLNLIQISNSIIKYIMKTIIAYIILIIAIIRKPMALSSCKETAMVLVIAVVHLNPVLILILLEDGFC